jgi:hypothetical protein
MRIDLQDLSTARLALELPGPAGEERVLVLRDAHELFGVLESSPEGVSLSGARARGLAIESLEWRTPSVHLCTGSSAEVSGLGAELSFARTSQSGMRAHSGRIEAEAVDRTTLSVNPAAHRVAGTVSASALALSLDPDTAALSVATLVCEEVQSAIAGLLFRVAHTSMTQVSARVSGRGQPGRATHATLGATTITRAAANGRGVDVSVRDVVFSRGLECRLERQTLSAPVLTIGEITVAMADIPSLLDSANAGTAEPAAADPVAGSPPWLAERFDASQLDRLTGHLRADIEVDASLPVIGRRVATHELRLPIADGMLNYKQLESGLSALEDAVLDFELKGEALVLERDLPVIRRRKDLVRWPLSTEHDRFLATQKSVRLRTLIAPVVLVPADADSAIEVARVAVRDLEFEFSATRNDGGQALGPGAFTDLEIGSARVAGELTFAVGDAPEGQLELDLESLSVLVRDFEVAGLYIEHARVFIGQVAGARLGFSGLAPRTLDATVRDVRVEELIIRRSDSRPHAP